MRGLGFERNAASLRYVIRRRIASLFAFVFLSRGGRCESSFPFIGITSFHRHRNPTAPPIPRIRLISDRARLVYWLGGAGVGGAS